MEYVAKIKNGYEQRFYASLEKENKLRSDLWMYNNGNTYYPYAILTEGMTVGGSAYTKDRAVIDMSEFLQRLFNNDSGKIEEYHRLLDIPYPKGVNIIDAVNYYLKTHLDIDAENIQIVGDIAYYKEKQKIYYKVVHKTISSVVTRSPDEIVQYQINQWVTPNAGQKPLFVFDSLENAQKFSANKESTFICKCEIGKIYNSKEYFANMTFPPGTLLTDKVKLLEIV